MPTPLVYSNVGATPGLTPMNKAPMQSIPSITKNKVSAGVLNSPSVSPTNYTPSGNTQPTTQNQNNFNPSNVSGNIRSGSITPTQTGNYALPKPGEAAPKPTPSNPGLISSKTSSPAPEPQKTSGMVLPSIATASMTGTNTSSPTNPQPQTGQNSNFNTNVQNLTNYGSGKESPEVTQARSNLTDFQKEAANQTRQINTSGTWTSRAMGQQHQADIQNAATNSALQTAVQNSLTSQGQQIGAAQQGGSLSQPVGQFGLLTNPQTGQPLNTGIFQSAIQQAQQLVNNNVPVNDPSVQALLAPFGFVGPLAFNQAMQAQQSGSWNPAAQSAVAGQNITQGVDSQQQAYNLNLGLQQLKTIQPVIANFLQSSGIKPSDVPAMNALIGNYVSNLKNPAATLQYQYMINDLQKFASQMLAAGAGGTPTGTQAATELMNPQNLSMNQIKYALDTLDNLGTNQISVLQQQSKASLGNTSGQYSGNPANVSNSVSVAPNNPGSPVNESAQSMEAKGALLGAGSWAVNQAKNIGPEILSFIGGLYAGGR